MAHGCRALWSLAIFEGGRLFDRGKAAEGLFIALDAKRALFVFQVFLHEFRWVLRSAMRAMS
jgi:hypothetical protein